MFVLAQEAGGLGSLSSLLPILLVGAVFWFLVIRPQRKRQQERESMLSTLSVGTEVVTIGGMFGEVEAMDDNWVDLLVGEDVVLRFARSAIGRIATDEDRDAIEAFVSGASTAEVAADAHDGIVDAHDGIVDAHDGIVDAHDGILDAHDGILDGDDDGDDGIVDWDDDELVDWDDAEATDEANFPDGERAGN